MSEEKKPEVDAKAKMLEALAKKQKGNTTGKSAGLLWFKAWSWSNWWCCAKDAPS